jgi:hypothetical protein
LPPETLSVVHSSQLLSDKTTVVFEAFQVKLIFKDN